MSFNTTWWQIKLHDNDVIYIYMHCYNRNMNTNRQFQNCILIICKLRITNYNNKYWHFRQLWWNKTQKNTKHNTFFYLLNSNFIFNSKLLIFLIWYEEFNRSVHFVWSKMWVFVCKLHSKVVLQIRKSSVYTSDESFICWFEWIWLLIRWVYDKSHTIRLCFHRTDWFFQIYLQICTISF